MGHIKGISICQNGPRLTHLLFADDSLIFCRAKESKCQKLLEVLAMYESASGQQINRDNTTLFFSKSTFQDMQNTIKTALGVQVVQQYEKYLGLPSFIGRKKKESFDNIKQRVWKKMQGWEGKFLSQAGREILIKAVAQALPIYAMSCFKLPIGLCHDIEVLVQKFFWDKEGKVEKFTGQNGKSFVNRRLKGEWGLKTFQGSMMPSWQNKLGASYMIKTHYSIEFLRPSFFHIVQLWRPLTQVQPHMHGKASLREEK